LSILAWRQRRRLFQLPEAPFDLPTTSELEALQSHRNTAHGFGTLPAGIEELLIESVQWMQANFPF